LPASPAWSSRPRASSPHTRRITDDKPAGSRQQQQALAEQPAKPAAAPKEEQPPARPVLFRGDLYDDGKFEGGSVEIEQQGDKWIVNETGNKYEYDEIASRDQSQIVAYSADYGSTLRWPVKGVWSRRARRTGGTCGRLMRKLLPGTDRHSFPAQTRPPLTSVKCRSESRVNATL
jgi:hypothetical protein